MQVTSLGFRTDLALRALEGAEVTDRGDYTVSFRSQKDGYMLAATPKQVDAEHRSFYAEDDGVIHAEEDKAADSNSPRLK